MRYCCVRWGRWMIRDWHLYRWITVRFGKKLQYSRSDWQRIL